MMDPRIFLFVSLCLTSCVGICGAADNSSLSTADSTETTTNILSSSLGNTTTSASASSTSVTVSVETSNETSTVSSAPEVTNGTDTVSTVPSAITTTTGSSTTSTGSSTTTKGSSTINAGSLATNTSESTTNASDSTIITGSSTTNAGETTINAGSSTTNAGETTTATGGSTTNASDSTTTAVTGSLPTNTGETTNAGDSTTIAVTDGSTTNAGDSTTIAVTDGSTTNAGDSTTISSVLTSTPITPDASTVSEAPTTTPIISTSTTGDSATTTGALNASMAELTTDALSSASNTKTAELNTTLSSVEVTSTADDVTTAGNISSAVNVSPTMERTSVSVEPTTTTVTTTTPTTTRLPPSSSICGVDVEKINDSSPCHPSKHKKVTLGSTDCDEDKLYPGDWLLLTTQDGTCGRITEFTTGTCYQPDQFGATYIWYLNGMSHPAIDSEATNTFCTTDVGSTKTGYCCTEKSDIDLMNCGGNYYIYKLSKSMPKRVCGKVALFKTADIPPFSHIIHNGETLPQKFEELEPEAQEQVVAFSLTIKDLAVFEKQWRNATTGLIEKLKEKLVNDRRRKRATDLSEVEVDVLAGYPKISADKTEALYLVSVHDAYGKPVEKRHVTKAIKFMEGDDPSGSSSGSEIGQIRNLPKALRLLLPTKPAPVDKPQTSKLWQAIIVIIGVTAFIVALSFIGVWCYSFSRRGRSGTMQVSTVKRGLVGDDELNNSYKTTQGHVNAAMDLEEEGIAVDSNQNANGKNAKDTSSIELQQVEENTV